MYTKFIRADRLHREISYLEQLVTSEMELLATSSFPDTMSETIRQENISGALCHITDASYAFFLKLDKQTRCFETDKNVKLYKGNFLKMQRASLAKSNELRAAWLGPFVLAEVEDTGLLEDLLDEVLDKYSNMSAKYFCKEYREENVKKEEAHRKQIKIGKAKKKTEPLSIKTIEKDSSVKKMSSHRRLQSEILADKGSLDMFTRREINKLYQAYNMPFKSRHNKTELSGPLAKKIRESEEMTCYEVFGNVTPTASSLQPQPSTSTDMTSGTSAEPLTDDTRDKIDAIHKTWFGNYGLLESHHGFVQWLFPIRENGMNFHSQELMKHEIKSILVDKEGCKRLTTSYKLMLDFYGMKLANEESGEIQKTSKWVERFVNLNRSTHNYLRITRILKFLGEFELEKYQVPWLEFMLRAAFVENSLPNIRDSLGTYWIGCVKADHERNRLLKLFKEYDQKQKNKEHVISDNSSSSGEDTP